MIRDIIAKRYAKAYFSLAQEQNRLLEAQAELNEFVAFLDGQSELSGVLYNPVFEVAQRKAVLNALLEKLEVSSTLNSLLGLLVDKNKLVYIGLVAENFSHLADAAEGKIKIAVSSAAALDKKSLRRLQKEFSRLTGKKVELEVAVDESLIGGIVARYEGMVYDGSIKTQLDHFGEALRA
ncbi:MAG: ATP synthase F1 subunit delta [Deltaproteobacteria bacterium]|nr:ATP synthase F1 subunit delta [Candidatus Tharpella aukensis]